ncbi:hypothetical protein [Pelagovum sp. HNIBRBA483]|uniref:hypothetical protein n=1 Tax=Pelagovum sp. HNIBRBA483 TaxID=3233341 RepID=UPI0034A1E36C
MQKVFVLPRHHKLFSFSFIETFGGFAFFKRGDDQGDPFQDDLKRLAEAAPHVLEDIGFARSISPAGETVWRRNGTSAVIRRGGGRVSVDAG